MRKAQIGLWLGLSVAAYGQVFLPPLSAPRNYGSPTGFGNILAPGMGTLPPHRAGTGIGVQGGQVFRGGFGFGGVGVNVGIGGGRWGGGFGGGFGRGQTIAVPYAVPVVVGGGYYQEQVPVPVPQQAPTVIINQTFVQDKVNPVVRDYNNLPETPEPAMRSYQAPPSAFQRANSPEEKPQYLLIAYKDGTVYQATGYTVEGDVMTYVGKTGRVTRVTLDQIDTSQTEKLNRDLGVEIGPLGR